MKTYELKENKTYQECLGDARKFLLKEKNNNTLEVLLK